VPLFDPKNAMPPKTTDIATTIHNGSDRIAPVTRATSISPPAQVAAFKATSTVRLCLALSDSRSISSSKSAIRWSRLGIVDSEPPLADIGSPSVSSENEALVIAALAFLFCGVLGFM
jgi:hypothetical protein